MKRPTSLWSELAVESASWCGTSAARDCKTVVSRVKNEGDSFLTITLPRFCDDFMRSLEEGHIADDAFAGFLRWRGLPRFLGGFLQQVFDTCGVLLDNPSIECIRSIRQLTLMFGKIERPSSPVRKARAMQRFVKIEEELGSVDLSALENFLPLFTKASTLLWADVFSEVENTLEETHRLSEGWLRGLNPSDIQDERDHFDNPMDSILGVSKAGISQGSQKESGDFHVRRPIDVNIVDERVRKFMAIYDRIDSRPIADELRLVPRHGPGATADRLRGNAKFDIRQWPLRLESVFPYGDYAIPNWRYYYQLDRVQVLESGAETPVKVVDVPKTPKSPRIIAVEPTAVQYAQQAFSQQIVNCLEKGPKLPPTGGGKDSALGRFFVGFQDQEANRLLAKEGSINNCLATLDLSDASDRVLNEHVLLLFSRFPRLSEAIQATRSTKAHVPGHGIITLRKFASMGSALCFPVEAMVFTTIVFAAIAYERRTPLDRALIMSMRGKVRVYGDDIVVPVEYVQRVIQFLELFGLKVNRDKSFWNGKFRESCGGDYYDGEWVTPIRFRRDFPRSRADVSEVVSLIAFRNLLYLEGYWKTVSKLDDEIRSLLKGRFPIGEPTAAGLVRWSTVFSYEEEWIDEKDHAPRVHGAAVYAPPPKSTISGEGALLKFFLKQGILPSQDKNHLERQGRPAMAHIKLRGIRPY